MLIRQKITNLNDEYHHIDPVGMFGVLTDASGNVLRNYVYDAFSDAPYKRQYVGESFPSQSNHTGTCQTALSEPGIITGNGGQGVVVPSRGFQVMGKQPGPVIVHACKSSDPTFKTCKIIGGIWGKIFRSFLCDGCQTKCYGWCQKHYDIIGMKYEKCLRNCDTRYKKCLATGTYSNAN